MRFIDLTGQRFGRLLVLNEAERTKNGVKWNCRCDCGRDLIVYSGNLRMGYTKSCGCMAHEKNLLKRKTHGKSNSRLYRIWRGIKSRCSDKASENYGGRGITVCEEWNKSFEAFCEWSMANGYSENLSIDRINNDGNYEPSNCRWVNNETQANNTRKNRKITINGETHTAREWDKIMGHPLGTISQRLHIGWPEERAVLFKGPEKIA